MMSACHMLIRVEQISQMYFFLNSKSHQIVRITGRDVYDFVLLVSFYQKSSDFTLSISCKNKKKCRFAPAPMCK